MVDREKVMKAVRDILCAIGEDPEREGLLETPLRIAKMYEEIFAGISNEDIEYKIFNEYSYDDMIIVKDIEFYSICEHHMVPFFGKAHIAYMPQNNKIIGISKLARIVDVHSKKLQIQENLCRDISNSILKLANAAGVAVIIEAEHLCMAMRGIKKPGAKTITMTFDGTLKTDAQKRMELLMYLKLSEK